MSFDKQKFKDWVILFNVAFFPAIVIIVILDKLFVEDLNYLYHSFVATYIFLMLLAGGLSFL